MPRTDAVLVKTHKARETLAEDFHRAVTERFPSGDVNVSTVCVAASGLVAAYLAALPDPMARTILLERMIRGLREELDATERDGLH